MNKNFQYILLGVAIVVFAVQILLKKDYAPDDTFIYLQYAKNLAAGDGFAFNPGENSYGVTSPLWVLILLIPFKTGIEPLFFAKLADIIFAFLSVLMFWRLTKNIFLDNKLYGIIALTAFIVNVWFIRWAYTGMETSLAVCLLILVFYNYYNRNFKLTFFLLGLFYLVRPETFLLAAVLWIVKLIHDISVKKVRYRNFIKYFLFYFLPIAPFWLYSIYTFNSIISNTAYGKSTMTFGFDIIVNQLLEIFKTLAPSDILSIILTGIFMYYVFKRKLFHIYAAIIIWVFAFILLYIITDADIISRYLLLITPLIIITGMKGLELISLDFHDWRRLIADTVSVIFIVQTLIVFFIFVKPHTDNFTYGIDNCLKPAALWLKDSTDKNSVVLVNDVGVVGYYSDRYIVDAAALINRDKELNKKIMDTPLEERKSTLNLLKFINCDYVIDRDVEREKIVNEIHGSKLELKLIKEFPSLGISGDGPVYYKIYKVVK